MYREFFNFTGIKEKVKYEFEIFCLILRKIYSHNYLEINPKIFIWNSFRYESRMLQGIFKKIRWNCLIIKFILLITPACNGPRLPNLSQREAV